MLLESEICDRELYVTRARLSSRARSRRRAAANHARCGAIEFRCGKREAARPPVRPSENGHQAAIRGVDLDTLQTADDVTAALESSRGAEKNDVADHRHGRQVLPGHKIDVAVARDRCDSRDG